MATQLARILVALASVLVMAAVVVDSAHAAPVPGQGTWETTLQRRDLDGNGTTDAFYDTDLDITWLRNADANGPMTWDAANTWAHGLTVGSYTNWRLPLLIDVGLPGCEAIAYVGTGCGYNVLTKVGTTVYSEMAHLYYDTLGNKGFRDTSGQMRPPGWGLTNTAGFEHLQYRDYWTGLEYAGPSTLAWGFTFDGFQYIGAKNYTWTAMAVHAGDIGIAVPTPVPEPETWGMLIAGLGLMGIGLHGRRHPTIRP